MKNIILEVHNINFVSIKILKLFIIPFLAEHSGPKQSLPERGMHTCTLFVFVADLSYSTIILLSKDDKMIWAMAKSEFEVEILSSPDKKITVLLL
jgi:hypothetical protein